MNFSVSSGTGNIVLPAADVTRGVRLTGVSARDVDLRVRIRTNKLAAGGSLYGYLVARLNGSSAYRPKIIIASNGTVSVHSGVMVNGVESSLGPAVIVPNLTHSANGFIWLRAQVTGVNPTTIRVKAWADGLAEPAGWQFTATNSAAALQAAGGVGLHAYMSSTITNAPVTFSFDDLLATADSQPPPPPPTGSVAADAFGRTTSNGWGSADTGGAYTLEGNVANFSVSSGTGNIVLPAADVTRGVRLTGVSARDVDLRVRIRTNKLAAGGSLYGYLVARLNGSSAYRPKIIIASNGTVSVHSGVMVNGVESSLGPAVIVPNLTHSANGFIWLRAQVTGVNPTTIRVKAWADGLAEPAGWQFTATNSAAALQAAGGVGLHAYMSSTITNAPVTFSFDDLLATADTVGAPAASMIVADETVSAFRWRGEDGQLFGLIRPLVECAGGPGSTRQPS